MPCEVRNAACVSLSPTTNFACVIVGGETFGSNPSNVYGLNKTLTEWTDLGKIRSERQYAMMRPIALPLS